MRRFLSALDSSKSKEQIADREAMHISTTRLRVAYKQCADGNRYNVSQKEVSWCSETRQPQRITLGLKTNFNQCPSYSAHKLLKHKILELYKMSIDTNMKRCLLYTSPSPRD